MIQGMLQDTCMADGASFHIFKAHQLQIFSMDIFARNQNYEKSTIPVRQLLLYFRRPVINMH